MILIIKYVLKYSLKSSPYSPLRGDRGAFILLVSLPEVP